MAIQSQPSRISEPFAGSGTKNVIPATNSTPSASQAASWASGFPPECSQPISAGGCPVPRNDMNGVLNQMSQDYSFRQDGGIWEWSALADYDAQRMVRGSDGKLYYSVAQSGSSTAAGVQDPTADNGTYWTAVPTDNANVVHISGTETITGIKTFSGHVSIKDDVDVYLRLQNTTGSFADTSTSPGGTVKIVDKNGSEIARLAGNLDGNRSRVYLRTHFRDNSNNYLAVTLDRDGSDKTFYSFQTVGGTSSSGITDLGSASGRWKQLYATTATINTSDARLKTEPEPLPDAVLDAWGDVAFVQFQMLDAVEAKGGEKARLHSGLVAQAIKEAFEARGLDAARYGLFCYDAWQARPEEKDKDGNVIAPAREAGDAFSLRYEEALCMEAAYHRRRADRAEARIAALEERLAAIEAKLNA